jgi:hypothetical protein
MADKPTKLKNKETAFRSNEELVKQVEARIKNGNKVSQDDGMKYIKIKGLKNQEMLDFYDRNMSRGFEMKTPSKFEQEVVDPDYKAPTTDVDIKNWRKYNTGVESMKADSVPSQLKQYLINTGYAESKNFGSGDTLEGKRILTRAKSVGINPEIDAEGNFKLADDVNTFKDTDKTFGKTRTINPNAKYVKKVYTKGKDIVNNYELAVPPTYQGKVPTEQELKDFDAGTFYQVGATSNMKKVYVPYLDPKKIPQDGDASTINANNQEMVDRYNTAQSYANQIAEYKKTDEYKNTQKRRAAVAPIKKAFNDIKNYEFKIMSEKDKDALKYGGIVTKPREDIFANGGMIKRADGSYSQRGLWDNIRANKGSGKAPTKEMLKQERKINAKHADGGTIDDEAGNRGMMKARMALDAHFGNPSAQRMVSPNPKTGMTPEGIGTHYMASMGNYAVPLLQDKGGNDLEYNYNPAPSREDMRFESPENAQYFAENYKNIAPMMRSNKFGNGGINNPGFNALPQNVQQKILANMAEGGTIHIKPENRGKFTAYKERTGKTTEEALHSPNAHVRQMANFAKNAAKWKHADGGLVLQENMYGNGGYLPKHVLGKTVGAATSTTPIKYPAMNTAVAESSGYNRNVMPVLGAHTMSPEEIAAARQQKIYGSMVAQNQNDAYRKNYDANKKEAFNQPTMRAEGTAKTATPMATAFAKNAHTGWKERLAAETAATGDKLRVSNKPNAFDDYFNVPSIVGGMASHIGQAPLQSQQTHSAMPYITAIGEPLVAGALSAAIHPMVHKMHIPTTGLVEGAVAGNLAGNAAKLGMNQLVKRGVSAAEHQGLTAIKGQIEGGGAHHAHGGTVTPKYRYSNGKFLPMHGGTDGSGTVVGTPPPAKWGANFAKANPNATAVAGMAPAAMQLANTFVNQNTDPELAGALDWGAKGAAAGSGFGPVGTIIGGTAGLIVGGVKGIYDRDAMNTANIEKKIAAKNAADYKTVMGEANNTNTGAIQANTGFGYAAFGGMKYNNGFYANGGMTVINRDHPNPQEEVEGGESAMLPNGKNVQFRGPKHTNGGIKTSLPEGTRIFSDQLIYPGKK